MSANFPPPPTYAIPVIEDKSTGKFNFNPVWLQWFLSIAAFVSQAGGYSGTITTAPLTSGGTEGNMIFKNGQLVSETAAT